MTEQTQVESRRKALLEVIEFMRGMDITDVSNVARTWSGDPIKVEDDAHDIPILYVPIYNQIQKMLEEGESHADEPTDPENPEDIDDAEISSLIEAAHEGTAFDAAAPQDVPEVTLDRSPSWVTSGRIPIVDLMILAKHAESRAYARRLVNGGGVSITFEGLCLNVARASQWVQVNSGMILKTGKRKYARIVVEDSDAGDAGELS